MTNDYQIEHEEHATSGRYVLTIEGEESRLTYSRADGRMLITHTYVPSALRGRDLGLALVARAVADARAKGVKIVPICPFVALQIARRPEWQDVLARQN
jgi:predicted GNAT family acetyltransferase